MAWKSRFGQPRGQHLDLRASEPICGSTTTLRKRQPLSEPVDAPIDVFDMTKVPGPMDTTIVQQQHYFEMARANLRILKAYLKTG